MELNEIMDKYPLPSFVGKKIKLIGYEAYRSVGVKLLKADNIEDLLSKMVGKKSYPPYQIHIIVEAIGGSFSLELGFNSPDYKLIKHAGKWMYYKDLPQDHDLTNNNNNNNMCIQKVSDKKFKDWYLSLMLTEFVK